MQLQNLFPPRLWNQFKLAPYKDAFNPSTTAIDIHVYRRMYVTRDKKRRTKNVKVARGDLFPCVEINKKQERRIRLIIVGEGKRTIQDRVSR